MEEPTRRAAMLSPFSGRIDAPVRRGPSTVGKRDGVYRSGKFVRVRGARLTRGARSAGNGEARINTMVTLARAASQLVAVVKQPGRRYGPAPRRAAGRG